MPGALAVPLLLAIVVGEEIVWRNAVTLPLAARLGTRGAGPLAAAAAFRASPTSRWACLSSSWPRWARVRSGAPS